jgi:hypothetical protein
MGSKFIKRSLLAVALLAMTSIPALALKLEILVNKVSQHMHVSVDGVNTYDWLVSTGGPGHETPTGTYNIFRMEKEHFSQEWDNAPMPNSMFFTQMGHAIHGSSHIARLGTKASHGCVRLAPENATILFDLVQKAGYKNSVVTIKGGLFDFGDSKNVADASSDTGSSGPRRSFLQWLNGDKAKPVKVAQEVAAPAPVVKKKKKLLKPHVVATTTEG